MSNLFPNPLTVETYWQTIHKQPLQVWLPALETLRQHHHLPAVEWNRFSLGRNVVFGCGDYVFKLCPPLWSNDAEREAAALTFIHNRLPVATPELVATGAEETWRYLIQRRLPGKLLHTFWFSLDIADKIFLARQHGELMAALHALPPPQTPPEISFDWAGMLAWQKESYVQEMHQAGVREVLLADLESYLEEAWPLLASDQDQAALHGDLNALNFLVEPQDSGWRIIGLVDWGDVKRGPVTHEFISPGVHMYRGEREALLAWYEGYGLTADRRTATLQHNIMARTMLYYADDFNRYLHLVPGTGSCRRWEEIASCFWHMR
jgi:hygromycin-B 7''-O-kinase